MRIVLSPHAQARSIDRKIAFVDIKNTIENYEIRTLDKNHRRRSRVSKIINGRKVIVVYEQRDNYFFVVTCATPDREG